MRTVRRCLVVGLACLLLSALVSADTLFLRDGRRIDGLLVGADSRAIDFDAQRGNGRVERMRVDRRDVLRIEFDQPRREEPPVNIRPEPGRRPAGLRERVLGIAGNLPWIDTEIDVREGQTVYFEASGLVTWAPGKRDGPAGQHNSPYNARRPIPSKSNACLIGKIGQQSRDYFYVGDDTGPVHMRASGRLFLGINDDVLSDNGSSFKVIIYY